MGVDDKVIVESDGDEETDDDLGKGKKNCEVGYADLGENLLDLSGL